MPGGAHRHPPAGPLGATACAVRVAKRSATARRRRGRAPRRRSSLSTRSAARNAEASVGPPSSSSDWTPSAASAASSSASGPLRSSRSRPSGSGPREKTSRRGWPFGVSTSRASSRGRSARAVPPPTATASTCARSSWTSAAALLAGHPALAGHDDASVERRRHLVDHERPPVAHPRPPGLVLDARLPRVDELDVDPVRAQPLLATRSLRVRVARAEDDALDTGGEDRLGARRRRAVMRARLERHVQRRVARPLAGRRERDDLGVATAMPPSPPRRRSRRRGRSPRRRSASGTPAAAPPLRARPPGRCSRERLHELAVRGRLVVAPEDRGRRRRTAWHRGHAAP